MAHIRRLSGSPSRPSTRDRNSMCTHLQLTRLFDEYGCERCSLCHKRPMLGWLYRCTQDFDGVLPASGFIGTESRRFDNDAQLYTLNASIIQAAADGHYDDGELELLWKQKREVRRTIQQIRPNTTSSTASTASSSAYSFPASTTTSTVRSSDTEPEIFNDHPFVCRTLLQPIQEVHPDLESATIEPRPLPYVRPSLAAPCTFKVCHNCRPVYRDRAWQSLDAILQNPYKAPSKHEVENKRISDVHHVKDIGGMKPGQRFYSQRQYDVESTRSQRNSRTEFADTVQRLLRNKDNMPEEVINIIRTSEAYDYGATLNSESSASSTYSSDDSDQIRNSRVPLYLRRGFERFSSITLPPKSASSQYAESGASPTTIDSTVSCPAVVEQTDESDDNNENRPPLREKRFIAKALHLEKTPKATVRFPIN